MRTILPNPFAGLNPVNGAAASSPQDSPCDAAAEFPRGFDPQRFFEAIEDASILRAPREVVEILARF